ncbi:hypothetical protein PHYSODRAFT_338321 [Phytophthora sojae]|uniref:Chromo domain-containing protein n=1 Tax=Phytophthora sojae (strain P6497) TaxID=1094619 RepID=G5A4E5_PHYSP|nr:hypothetical protein PHYSODRAFT_338321 [Phytophthora sojae]EGZ09546.1 hypothetical protein PHYSODRAFT_338321 [Phytophthora sojae]|eukprot:XP_009534407.1 hypothetical protein PHYSODRAFT_338321 [Phytophthora sojae]
MLLILTLAAAMPAVLRSLCRPPPCSSCCSRCPRYRYARRDAVAGLTGMLPDVRTRRRRHARCSSDAYAATMLAAAMLAVQQSLLRKRRVGSGRDAQPPRKARRKAARTVNYEASDDEFEVEKIIEMKFVRGEPKYHVTWKGYDEASWEPESNLHCPELLNKFLSHVTAKIPAKHQEGSEVNVGIDDDHEVLESDGCSGESADDDSEDEFANELYIADEMLRGMSGNGWELLPVTDERDDSDLSGATDVFMDPPHLTTRWTEIAEETNRYERQTRPERLRQAKLSIEKKTDDIHKRKEMFQGKKKELDAF